MRYQNVPTNMEGHAWVRLCADCGALIAYANEPDHDKWHLWLDELAAVADAFPWKRRVIGLFP